MQIPVVISDDQQQNKPEKKTTSTFLLCSVICVNVLPLGVVCHHC